MAYDKVVDSEQLDHALRSTAYAIRTCGYFDSATKIDFNKETGFADAITDSAYYLADEAYKMGKKEVWNAIQWNGKRTNYSYGFYCPNSNNPIWDNSTFKPMYDIVPVYANRTFRGIGVTNMQACLASAGVKLDFSKCKTYDYTFAESNYLESIGELVINVPENNEIIGTFVNCSALTTIDSIKFNFSFEQWLNATGGKGLTLTTMFKNCTKLKNITFNSYIYDSLNFQWSVLDEEAVISILEHLYSFDGILEGELEGYAPTITLSATNYDRLALGSGTAPDGMPWIDYANNLGWTIKK